MSPLLVVGTPNRVRRGDGVGGGRTLVSQASSVTEAASDEIDCDMDQETPRVTKYVSES